MRLLEGGYASTKLTSYPKGDIGAVYPLLAWDGVWAGPELPILGQELMTLYQGVAALNMEQQG